MEKGIADLLPLILGQGGVAVILSIVSWLLWQENKRLRGIVENNAKDTLELLLRVIKVVGRFNRIAGGESGGDDDDDGA
jgi:hypothetical protein